LSAKDALQYYTVGPSCYSILYAWPNACLWSYKRPVIYENHKYRY